MHKSLPPALFLATITLAGCQSDENNPTSVNVQSGLANSVAQAEFDNILSIAEKDINDRNSASAAALSFSIACATVSWDNVNTITIDFGSDGSCKIGNRARKGKLVYQYSGGYFVTGSVTTITLLNYAVEDMENPGQFIAIQGEKIITNLGIINGKKTWDIEVNNGKLLYADGSSVLWNSDRIRILHDSGTLAAFDETYHLYGTSSGTTRSGITYTAETTSDKPLVLDVKCALTALLPTSGIVSVSPQNMPDSVIDFGYRLDSSVACDSSFSVTVGRITRYVSL